MTNLMAFSNSSLKLSRVFISEARASHPSYTYMLVCLLVDSGLHRSLQPSGICLFLGFVCVCVCICSYIIEIQDIDYLKVFFCTMKVVYGYSLPLIAFKS